MKMKNVSVTLFIFVLMVVIRCEGCWKEEKEVLRGLNCRFGFPLSWHWEGTDCCEWEGVECNSSTGRVAKLDLNGLWSTGLIPSDWHLNYADLVVFKDLKSLNLSHSSGIFDCAGSEVCLNGLPSLKSLYLSYNRFHGTFNGLCSMLKNLEVFDLSYNNLSDSDIASALSGLSSLKSLNLGNSQLTPRSILRLLALTSLEILDLGSNRINSFVLHQGLKSLSKLDLLTLDDNEINGSKLRESLQAFSSIRVLFMENNDIIGTITAGDFRDLSNLEHLVLDDNDDLDIEFFRSIGELTSLKVLSAFRCFINGTLPSADWFKLKNLEELDLGQNQFVGSLPSSFLNMTSLRKLELSRNQFTGQFDSNIASLTSLEHFGFTENQFEVPISFTPFANHSNLKFIYGGEGNKVILDLQPSLQTWIPKFQLQVLSLSSTTETDSLPLPRFLLHQNNLTSLDFTSCRLEGEFPNWLFENNTKLTELLVRNCSFTGVLRLPLHPLTNMRRMDVSDNNITGEIPSNNISSILPNLQFLNLSTNHIQGSISPDFGQLILLDTLDLSDNRLSGEIPKNISGDGSLLKCLKLSHNDLDGPIFPTLKFLEQLFLDDNSFYGSIPSSFFNSSLQHLDLSHNNLVGKLPSVVGNLSNWKTLSLSSNHLEGSIPTRLVELEYLSYLDISDNNLTGSVPSFVNSSVNYIHLSNNRLSGLSKRMFSKRSFLMMLELSYNEITSSIQDMMQDLADTRLNILILKGNRFTGHLPEQLCQLVDLSILDLSYNNFFGPIPNCLGKMPFENEDPDFLTDVFIGFLIGKNSNAGVFIPHVNEKANFTTKKTSYTYTGSILAYMSGIDLSKNKLNGSIPSELGNLTRIRSLNLSHNDLIGQIPTTFSNLVQTESLDLSFNMLSGQIPHQLNQLSFLAVFSVAHNNLSGDTPERKGQFITFDESSYEGNPLLCGPPLLKSCHPSAQSPTISPNDEEDNDSPVDMHAFGVSFAVAYTTVLLVIVATLYINPYWRRAWFSYMEFIVLSSYYFMQDSWRRFSNSRNVI
ncbi:hypothetical protein PHAVU_008G108400 [Phaseolus vulgaris]|uniref:Leucine-rich repeat-containing N-terminal plant-type domain-containing protein n=1 Tax=Phaseolus vulgaris TaxID=3885 RepID=V7B6B9_PHAVU|nr:hypothetical protein PHAVU_008G108400g [Phaseolus vulgaris]ESW12393.1 hypothetical protein PHAVU_008G108400g [Phaseolus vulgaris]